MDIEKLRYFRVVAQEEHMTRAAQKINITQPSLSSIVSNMEAELGVKLFERAGRQIQLNKYGKVFSEGVEDILDRYDHVLRQLEALQKENEGDIKIAVTGLNFPRRILSSFAEEFPQIRIIMRLIRADEIESTLKHSDAGIVLSSINAESDRIASLRLYGEKLCAVVPASDPLAQAGEEISILDLKDRSLAMTPSNTAFRIRLNHVFEKAGYDPRIAMEGYTEQIRQMVADGIACSIVSESDTVLRFNDPKIKALRLKEDYCRRDVYLLTQKGIELTKNELSFYEFAQYEKEQFSPAKQIADVGAGL